MPAITAQNMIDRAAAIADQHDDFVTPKQWLAWVNAEVRALDIFAARSGWIQQDPLPTSVSSAPYSITLLAETLCVLGVWEENGGRYRKVRYSDTISSRMQDPTNGSTVGAAREFWIERTDDEPVIRFFPRPTSGTYVCLSVTSTPQITALTDSVTYPLGFEELIVRKLAKMALIKEESNTSAIERLITQEEQRIEEICWNSVLAESPRVRRAERSGWDREPLYPEAKAWVWL